LNRLNVFVIRAVVGAVFAVLLSRIFYPQANMAAVTGLGLFLVGMAYVAEYFRNKKSG
jgi:hypothetical protein